MDPYAQAGMIFTVVMTIIVGGFIVTFPIMRRLGRVMEESIRERQAARIDQHDRSQLGAQLEELRGVVHQLEGHVGLLAERQDFVDNLLSHREPGKLSEGEDWRRS
jgi:hypothetical protein